MLTVEPQVIEKYVKTGKAKLVFRDVLNHGERSVRMSEAAACAGKQNKFWEMHGILFERQDDTYNASSGVALIALAKNHASTIQGLDINAFAQCMESRATWKAIQAADAEQRGRGITSQPIFEINGTRLVGLQSLEVMSGAIDKALK